jgi:hypothetical protein
MLIMTERVGVDQVSKVQGDVSKVFPNVSLEKLGGGFNQSVLPEEMIRASINSMYVKHRSRAISEGIRREIIKDARKISVKPSEYLEMLASFHEKKQDYPSKDVNVVIVRLICHLQYHLMETNQSHTDLVHDLQEIREKLSGREEYILRSVTNEFEESVIQERLKSIFS